MSIKGQDSVNQRLTLIVDTFEKGIKSAFAAKIGISAQGVHDLLSGRKGSPSFKVLSSILESYPTLDANWLVLGRGPMLHEEIPMPAQEQPRLALSAEQIEGIVRETIITQLALSPAAKREADETAARAAQIAALELDILNIRIRTEELNQQAADIKLSNNYEDNEPQLTSITKAVIELVKDLNAKYQLIMMLRMEEKRKLQDAIDASKLVSLTIEKNLNS